MFPPPWASPDRADKAAVRMDWDAEHLILLARESATRRHYKVAMQRSAMLVASGIAIPPDLQAMVDQNWFTLSVREQLRMELAARSWARLVLRNAGGI